MNKIMNEENKRSEEDAMPLVTFALFAYNQEQYIREAMEAALAQTYENLEIIVSDDASPDKTFEIMQECVAEYNGAHKIILNRNERNLGLAGHVNKVFEMSNGEIIVMAAGDDVSVPERVQVIVEEFDVQAPNTMIVYSNGWRTDEHGAIIEEVGNSFAVQYPYDNNSMLHPILSVPGALMAWRCQLMTEFGPISIDNIAEDNVLTKRAMLLGRIAYADKCLVQWRRLARSLTTDMRDHWHKSDVRERRLGSYKWDSIVARQLVADLKATKNPYTDIIPLAERQLAKSEFLYEQWTRPGSIWITIAAAIKLRSRGILSEYIRALIYHRRRRR